MAYFQKPLVEITPADIRGLCEARESESSELEFKEVPIANGEAQFKEPFRDKLALAVVAFAAADGGAIILGVKESREAGNRSRAADIAPMPMCEEVADRLLRSMRDVIDPPLAGLKARGIPTQSDKSGIVVVSVPRDRRHLHRVTSTRRCAVRSATENRELDMREINDLVLSFANEIAIVEKITAVRQRQSNEQAKLHRGASEYNLSLLVSAVPLNPISLWPISRRDDLAPVKTSASMSARESGAVLVKADGFWSRPYRSRRPSMRSEIREDRSDDRLLWEQIHSDGSVAVVFSYNMDDKPIVRELSGELPLYVNWALQTFSTALLTAAKLRRVAGQSETPYVMQFELAASKPARLRWGEADWSGRRDRPIPSQIFPTYELAESGFEDVLRLFVTDLNNAAGTDFDASALDFRLTDG